MMLFWKTRYLDRRDKLFKDRYLYLLTEALDPVLRAAIGLVTEAKSEQDRRQILRFRSLFIVRTLDAIPTSENDIGEFCSVGPWEYFEDETGAEIKTQEPRDLLKPDDAPDSEPESPIPVAEVFLTDDEMRLLAYFLPDQKELAQSALMQEGPGALQSPGAWSPTGRKEYSFKTTLTDDEIRSAVTIFRRLYMEKEPANVGKAATLFARAVGDHAYTQTVASFADEFRKRADGCFAPMMLPGTPSKLFRFTTKRLIDGFLNTRYAHQPYDRRERQFTECREEVKGNLGLLFYFFLWSVWDASIHMLNVGSYIDRWSQCYWLHHNRTPGVLESLRHHAVGIAELEKENTPKARLLSERAERLASELWTRERKPEGGPGQFLYTAREQLERVLWENDGRAEQT